MRLSQLKHQFENISLAERLARAEKVDASERFQHICKYVSTPTYNFPKCQVRNQRGKANARRFTLDEKVLAVALYKGLY